MTPLRTRVTASVRCARLNLTDAQDALSDAGLSSDMLDDLAADSGLLLSIWEGRAVIEPDVPAYIGASAAEYRAQRARRGR